MRKLELYVKKYGPETGPKLYHLLQSQAAHAGVSARLRRKLHTLTEGGSLGTTPKPPAAEDLPLFRNLTAERPV